MFGSPLGPIGHTDQRTTTAAGKPAPLIRDPGRTAGTRRGGAMPTKTIPTIDDGRALNHDRQMDEIAELAIAILAGIRKRALLVAQATERRESERAHQREPSRFHTLL